MNMLIICVNDNKEDFFLSYYIYLKLHLFVHFNKHIYIAIHTKCEASC